jgi:hypothetical protein
MLRVIWEEEYVRLGCRCRLVPSRPFGLEEILDMGNVMAICFGEEGESGGVGGVHLKIEMMSIKIPSI